MISYNTMTDPKQFYPKFESNDNKGFTITFDNLLTISVQWGIHNYSSNKGSTLYNGGHRAFDSVSAITAEIAIWDTNNNWFDFGHDTVCGYLKPNQVAEWITLTSQAKDIHDLQRTAKAYESYRLNLI